MSSLTALDGPTISIAGAHRGGLNFTDALLPAIPADRSLKVRVADLNADRAEALAGRWRESGADAVARSGDAARLADLAAADVLVLATDDASVQYQVLRAARPPLLLAGLIVAAQEVGEYGGSVLGLAAVVPEQDENARRAADALFSRLAALAPRRTTGANVRNPLLNGMQANNVRELMYRGVLARAAHAFLAHRVPAAGLFLAQDWPGAAVSPLRLEDRGGRSRVQMRGTVRRTGRSAAAFIDPGKSDWLYLVGEVNGCAWSVELPAPQLRQAVVPAPRPAATD